MKKLFAFLIVLVLALGISVHAAAPEIPALAGIVVNADTGEAYFAKEPHLERAMASTTKVVTGILAIENTENYDGPVETRDRTLPAIATDLADSGDSKMDLVLGEELTIYDAVRGMLFPSGNDAARLLARTVGGGSYNAFAEKMNALAKQLGCTQTCFSTASGRDSIGHYTTAADYAVMVNYAMSNPKFRAMVAEPSYVIEADPAHGVVRHELKNGNLLMHGGTDLIGEPYEGATGVKGGNTGNAKRCLTFSATRTLGGKEVNLVSVSLGANTKADNWDSTRMLMDYGFETAAAQPYTVTAEGNKLTVTNPATGYVMTATISASDAAYTGSAVETATVTTTYPEGTNWYRTWDIAYTNNVEKGTATASITYDGKTASVEFDIVEPTVTLSESAEVDTLIVPAGQTYDLNGKILVVNNGLVVNEGGKIMGGMLYVSKDAIAVNMGSNGGWIPMWSGESENYDIYDFYSAEIKAGKSIVSTDEGTKYSFGYKMTESTSEFSPYADAVAAGDKIEFGVELTLDGEAVDYSFSQESIAKMEGIDASAASDEFFKVNLNLAGTNNDLTKVRVAPVVKVGALGFRYVGADTGEGSGEYVARINTQGYYTLEDAVAAAKASEGIDNVKLVGDVAYKRPVTIKLDGNTRFVINARAKATISGPITFDGMSDEGVEANGLIFRIYGEGTLTLKDGVVIRDNKNIRNEADEHSFGAAARVEGTAILNLDGVKFINCSGRNRGAIYMTGSSVVNIKNSAFENNAARTQFGGAVAIYSGGTLNVENTVFKGNSAATYGGAIGIYDSDVAVTLRNNTFTDNTSGDGYIGGAIGLGANYTGELIVDGGSFSGNSADDIGKSGGAVTLEGAIKGLDEITLAAYEYISVGETLALEETASLTVDGSVTLSGSEVNAGKYITEDGMRTSLPNYVAGVGDKRYESLVAAIEATKSATAATVIELFADDTVTAATTVTLNPNVQIKVTADSVISGPLTIQGTGTAHASAVPILVDGCKLTLKDGVTLKNITSTFTETDEYHGIIRIQNGGEIELNKVTVTGCKAPNGVLGGKNSPVITLIDSTLSNNEGTGSAGVIFLYNGTVNATNTVFDGNTSGNNGGVIHVGTASGKLNMTGCTFTNNTAGNRGGAISFQAASTGNTFTNCTFTGNVSTKQGGAVVFYGSAKVTFDGVTMSGNKASKTTANAISYMKGSLELKGAVDIDVIAMNSGCIITLDAPATFAHNVTVSGPKSGAATFTGSKVSEYYKYFTHKTTTLTFDSTGTCVSK